MLVASDGRLVGALAVAERVGVPAENVRANVLPDEKAHAIESI